MRLIDTPDTAVRLKIAASPRKRSSRPPHIEHRFHKNLSCKIVSPARSNIYRNERSTPDSSPDVGVTIRTRSTRDSMLWDGPATREQTVHHHKCPLLVKRSDDRVAANEPEPA